MVARHGFQRTRFGAFATAVAGLMWVWPDPAVVAQEQSSQTGAGGQDSAPPAQSAPTDPQASDMTPPDIVRLRDGSMYRGAISELVPETHVVIVLITGEARRFDMKDVVYAGAAASEPETATSEIPTASVPEPGGGTGSARTDQKQAPGGPLVIVHGERVRLRFSGNHPHLTFHVGTGVDRSTGTVVGVTPYSRNDWFVGSLHSIGDRFDRICTAPCEASLPTGSYTLAISTPESELLVVDEPLHVRHSGSIRGVYESNAGIRTTGWIIGGAALAAGLALTIIGYLDRSTPQDCDGGPCQQEANTALVISGLAVTFAGVLAGAIMVAIDDEASVVFTPQ